MEQKPSIGRIVVYNTTEQNKNDFRDKNESRKQNLINIQDQLPAIIVAVWNETTVNLKVFMDGYPRDMWITSSVKGDLEGQWNFPIIIK